MSDGDADGKRKMKIIRGGGRGRTKMFSTVVVPWARAANNKMRLLKLLEPGSLTWPSTTRTGCTVSFSTLVAAAPQMMVVVDVDWRVEMEGMERAEGWKWGMEGMRGTNGRGCRVVAC